ncbi:MAG TPA: tetratricopeptide repeat protein [Chloroflexota bacterium]|nr:tetratricopeptide repeat protein [Chloroflexota bacterium]
MRWSQRIYLFGTFRAEPPLALSSRQAQRLLVFLLLHPGQPHGRDQLAAHLWSDAPPDRGRRALSDALYRLRQSVPAHWLDAQSESIALTPPPDLWVDVWEFRRLAASELAQAVALYQGDLAPEVEDEWIWGWRERLREELTAVLLSLAEAAENGQQYDEAAGYYGRLATLDELNEAAHRGLMRGHAAHGRLADALAIYQSLQQLLAAELNVAPAAATQQLARQLQAEWELQEQTAVTFTTTPFVGRVAERTQLLARLDEARAGRGGLLVLLGEAGMGKSRLLESLAQSADWRGWQVGWGRGEQFALPAPYAPLAEALTAVLPRPRLQQLARLLPPWPLTLADQIVPAIGRELALAPLPESPRREQQLPVALRLLLDGLQQIAPHLLILDDVQWADTAVWPLLTHLQPALAEMSVLVVVSGRLGELQQQTAVWQTLTTWEQQGARVLRLAGLEPQALAEMARVLGRGPLSTAALARLHQASGGNPLLAQNLLELDDPAAQPELMSLQRQRLARLSDAARLSLQAAAVLGLHFDYDLWEAVMTGIPAAELPTLAGELEERRLLILETNGYRFSHDTLRACVYLDTPPERRQQWHGRALAALTHLRPEATLSLLYHAQESGDDTAVARYALLAGQESLPRYANQAARELFTQALAALPPDDAPNRYAALLGRARALGSMGERADQEADLAQLQTLARQLGDPAKLAHVLALQAKFYWQTSHFAQARQAIQDGLQLSPAPDAQAILLETLGQVERDQGNYQAARMHFEQAGQLYRQLGNPAGVANILVMSGIVAQRLNDFTQAIPLYQQALATSREIGSRSLETLACGNLVTVYWGMGDYQQAIRYGQRALALGREVGELWSQASSLGNLGSLYALTGDFTAAIEHIQQALAILRLTRDRQSMAINLSNLANLYLDRGQLDEAIPLFTEALSLNREMGRRRGEGYALHGRGTAYYQEGRWHEAVADLQTAVHIRAELGESSNLCFTQADLALALLAGGDAAAAQRTVQAALDGLSPQTIPEARQQVHFAAYEILLAQGQETKALYQLALAEQVLWQTADALPEAQRPSFLQLNPRNQVVLTAVNRHTRTTQTQLVKTDVPSGRRLTAADYTAVTWTLTTVADELAASPAARRQQVIQRLLQEAAAQGAAATDDDLAQALGVSRRTVLRDRQALATRNP